MLFPILLPKFVAGDHILVINYQSVAENGGPVKLFHQRLCKLVKGVGEDNCLGECAEFVHKSFGTIQGLHGGNHILNIFKSKAMLLENPDSPFHKNIIVRDIPCSEPEFLNSSLLSHINPDFRY